MDFQTVQDRTVTIRDRDTMGQVRAPVWPAAALCGACPSADAPVRHAAQMDDAAQLLAKLCRGRITWADAVAKYPKFTQQEA